MLIFAKRQEFVSNFSQIGTCTTFLLIQKNSVLGEKAIVYAILILIPRQKLPQIGVILKRKKYKQASNCSRKQSNIRTGDLHIYCDNEKKSFI